MKSFAQPGPSEGAAFGGVRDRVDQHPVLVAVFLVVAQIAIRLPGAGAESIWWDEASTASLALSSFDEIIAWSSTRDQTPPLYFLVMSGWAQWFGISELSLRGFSVLASALAGVVLYPLARRHYGFEAALYSILGYSASGLFLYYAHEARAYALLSLLCAASFSLFLRNFDRPRLANSLALAAVNAASAYVHYTILFALLAQLVGALALYHRRKMALAHYVGSQVLAAALFVPWLGNLLRVTPAAADFWSGTPGLAELGTTLLAVAGGPWPCGASVILVVSAGLLLLLRRMQVSGDRSKIGVLVLWTTVPVVTSFIAAQWVPAFGIRYLLTAAEGLILLQAVLIASLPIKMRARGALALALAVLAWVGPGPISYVKSDWRAATSLIEGFRTGRTTVMVSPAGRCLPLAYYLAPERLPELSSRGLGVLAEDGIHCVTTVGDVPAMEEDPPVTVIQVLGRGATVQPDDLMAAFGHEHRYNRVAFQRLPGVFVVPYRR